MSSIQFNSDFEFEYGVIQEISPGLRRIVARNPGPFTFKGTGTYIIGHGEVAVVDPGPMMPDHVEAMLQGLRGETISHILVTHTHSDHSPASRPLQAACGAPILSFGPHAEDSAGALEGGVDRDFAPDFHLQHGEIINGSNWRVEAIHTPGHCSNHLCFALPDSNEILCGDQLMAWSTTVILPPDGNISDYIVSLEQLKKRSEKRYWPTHGAAIDDPHAYIDQVIHHRLQRIEQVATAIQQGARQISQLRQIIYPHIENGLYAGAELSIKASLDYLENTGRVRPVRTNKPGGLFEYVDT